MRIWSVLRRAIPRSLIVFSICASAWPDTSHGHSFWPGKDDPLTFDDCVKIATGSETTRQAPDAGTDKLCKVIGEAWQKYPPKHFEPELSVLAVKFDVPQPACAQAGTRGINASALARLISLPNLLPPHFSGGLALHDVTIGGAFTIYSATVMTPVAFVRAAFCGGTVDRTSLGLEKREQQYAIYLNAMHFKKRFMISDSTFTGRVVIANSRFEDTLAFVKSKFEENTVVPFTIIHSSIKPALVILEGRYPSKVVIYFNSIGSFVANKAAFVGGLDLTDNEIEKVYVDEVVFAPESRVSTNRVKGSLRLLDVTFDSGLDSTNDVDPSPKEDDPSPKKADYEIADNQIGGSLQIRFTAVESGKEIDLQSNVVKGDANIELPVDGDADAPKPWKGTINLANFTGGGSLSLKYSESVGRDSAWRDDLIQARSRPFPWSSSQNCSDIYSDNETSKDILRVNLKAADIRILEWNIPLRCEFRWEGAGLRYKHWGSTEADESERRNVEKMMSWRYIMSEPDVDALTFMADYLASRGSLSHSREVRREAKELNYRPTTLIEGGPPWIFSGGLMYVLLAPTGWGANPEWALFLITFGWISSLGIYQLYRIVYYFVGWNSKTRTIGSKTGELGMSDVSGFMQFDQNLQPKKFMLLLYSLDAMLPIVNLRHFDIYYPYNSIIRIITVVQHVLGWWWLSALIATAAIL